MKFELAMCNECRHKARCKNKNIHCLEYDILIEAIYKGEK